jgi:predicted nuclease of restriction endonuclease-like (RecB) superfamily
MKIKKEIVTIPAYAATLMEIKSYIQKARHKAFLSANKEVIILYWRIGASILEQQHRQGWGAKIIEHLAKDLQKEFPEMKGLSLRNLKYMRKFASLYEYPIVQVCLAQLTWYHNIAIMDKIKDTRQGLWYAEQAAKNGWSRDLMVHQIESRLYQRQTKVAKVTNFAKTLPAPQSDLAQETIKDPYIFDFLDISYAAKELALQRALVTHITRFLLELGSGFAFVGQQYHLEVSGKDFYIDLLFYHLKLKCYFVVELKTGDFKPEYAGQLNFYLSAVDSQIKGHGDNPTIGIILCKNKDRIIAEYALRSISNPMSVAEYKLSRVIPDKLQNLLPAVEAIETEMTKGKKP